MVEYIGSNQASHEGMRHYFIINLKEEEQYDNFEGTKCSKLPVYVSSGANTGNICKEKLCIIPFFGLMTMWQDHKAGLLMAVLIKVDYIQHFKKLDTNNIIEKYFNPISIDNVSLESMFNIHNRLNRLNEYKTKVGCKFFFDIINKRKDEIKIFIENLNKQTINSMPNLTFLNSTIGKNNIFGIDLSKVSKFSDYFSNKPEDIERIKLTYCIDKSTNILNSPFIDKVFEELKNSKKKRQRSQNSNNQGPHKKQKLGGFNKKIINNISKKFRKKKLINIAKELGIKNINLNKDDLIKELLLFL